MNTGPADRIGGRATLARPPARPPSRQAHAMAPGRSRSHISAHFTRSSRRTVPRCRSDACGATDARGLRRDGSRKALFSPPCRQLELARISVLAVLSFNALQRTGAAPSPSAAHLACRTRARRRPFLAHGMLYSSLIHSMPRKCSQEERQGTSVNRSTLSSSRFGFAPAIHSSSLPMCPLYLWQGTWKTVGISPHRDCHSPRLRGWAAAAEADRNLAQTAPDIE